MSYGRRLTLDVGGVRIEHSGTGGLRVAFEVERDKSRDPNSASVTIWNLAPATREAFEDSPRLFCELSAGYADQSVASLFRGVLLDVENIRDGSSFATTLTLGDDGEAKTALRRIHRTFPAGMLVSTVLRELVKATGLKGGNLEQASGRARLAASAELPRAHLATGSALGELAHFSRSLGFEWTIQDQEIVFLGLGKGTAGSGPLITSSNVEGSPALDGEGNVSFDTRLIPDLIPGRPFRLETERVSGLFVATRTKHMGDTHGGDWSIGVAGEPFESSIARGLVVNGA